MSIRHFLADWTDSLGFTPLMSYVMGISYRLALGPSFPLLHYSNSGGGGGGGGDKAIGTNLVRV